MAEEVAEKVKTQGADDEAARWAEFVENFELEPVVYFIGAPNGLVKIGFATDLDERFSQLLASSPVPLRILAFTTGGRTDEGAYHERFKAHRRHYEWFEMCPEIEAEIKRLNAPNLKGTTP